MQLIEIFQPGNIGASARALKNIGFRNLDLISPVHHITDEDNLWHVKLLIYWSELQTLWVMISDF